jgi:hypothetical protein
MNNIAATQMQITYRGTAPQKFTICDGRDAQYMDLDFTVWRPFSPVSTVGVTLGLQIQVCDCAFHSRCIHTTAASSSSVYPDTIYDISMNPMKEAWPVSSGHPAMRR